MFILVCMLIQFAPTIRHTMWDAFAWVRNTCCKVVLDSQQLARLGWSGLLQQDFPLESAGAWAHAQTRTALECISSKVLQPTLA